jgi:hypothetical protein
VRYSVRHELWETSFADYEQVYPTGRWIIEIKDDGEPVMYVEVGKWISRWIHEEHLIITKVERYENDCAETLLRQKSVSSGY